MAMAFLRRMLKETWQETFLPPYLGLTVRSGILWGLGDVGAQAVTHYTTQDKDDKFISFVKNDEEFKINWYRVWMTSIFGVGSGSCIGPAEYYKCAKRNPMSSTTTAEFLISTSIGGLFDTLCLATFFPFMGCYAQGRTKSLEQAKEDVKRGFTPALLLGGAVLPVALFTNWRFVPAPYQLHFASLSALVGSCYLSWNELELHKRITQAHSESGRRKV